MTTLDAVGLAVIIAGFVALYYTLKHDFAKPIYPKKREIIYRWDDEKRDYVPVDED